MVDDGAPIGPALTGQPFFEGGRLTMQQEMHVLPGPAEQAEPLYHHVRCGIASHGID